MNNPYSTRPANVADEPNCAGRWHTFDSIDATYHQAAAALCSTCPLVAACERRIEALSNAQRTNMVGTWAGKLYDPGKTQREAQKVCNQRLREKRRTT